MGLPSLPELIVIFSVLVLLFGAAKIPKLFGAFGEGIRNFKKGLKDEGQDATGQNGLEGAREQKIEGGARLGEKSETPS